MGSGPVTSLIKPVHTVDLLSMTATQSDTRKPKRRRRMWLSFCYLFPIGVSGLFLLCHDNPYSLIVLWSFAQFWTAWLDTVEPYVFAEWEKGAPSTMKLSSSSNNNKKLQIPVVDVRQWQSSETNDADDQTTTNINKKKGQTIQQYLVDRYGSDWRSRPLLLRNVIDHSQLGPLLLQQLLTDDNLVVPYFTNATNENALSPDALAPIQDIVYNISKGQPHKIGSQLFFQRYPHFVSQLAPPLLTELFGNHFTPSHVSPSHGLLGRLLPPLTTVPLFVASNNNNNNAPVVFTPLHCEPIGNLAVQVLGSKVWILVEPSHWKRLRPRHSPDRRAYFVAQQQTNPDGPSSFSIPSYSVTTQPGDVLWIPTWTWHRVDYVGADQDHDATTTTTTTTMMSLSASLFHFRPYEFIANHPLFATLILPALLQEVVGSKTQ